MLSEVTVVLAPAARCASVRARAVLLLNSRRQPSSKSVQDTHVIHSLFNYYSFSHYLLLEQRIVVIYVRTYIHLLYISSDNSIQWFQYLDTYLFRHSHIWLLLSDIEIIHLRVLWLYLRTMIPSSNYDSDYYMTFIYTSIYMIKSYYLKVTKLNYLVPSALSVSIRPAQHRAVLNIFIINKIPVVEVYSILFIQSIIN